MRRRITAQMGRFAASAKVNASVCGASGAQLARDQSAQFVGDFAAQPRGFVFGMGGAGDGADMQADDAGIDGRPVRASRHRDTGTAGRRCVRWRQPAGLGNAADFVGFGIDGVDVAAAGGALPAGPSGHAHGVAQLVARRRGDDVAHARLDRPRGF